MTADASACRAPVRRRPRPPTSSAAPPETSPAVPIARCADRGNPTIVVLRALGLGDLCTAVPALRGLRRAFAGHRMVLAAPATLEPLALLSGGVDEVVDLAGIDEPLPPSCRAADLAINLHGCGPESSLLLTRTGPRRLLAFAHADLALTAGGPRWDPGEHEVERWCRLVSSIGAHAEPLDLHLASPPPGPSPGVVVHPGAASGSRRWPVGRWAAVVRALLDAGRRVMVTGTRAEVALASEVVAGASAGSEPRCLMAAGRTDLMELAGLVAGAELLVAGDTGVAHLATAFATPSVLLFGPTSPRRWGPITDGPHRVLWAGRTGDPHGPTPDPGLLELTVADVVAAIASAGGPSVASSATPSRPASRLRGDGAGQSLGSTSSR